MKYKKHTAVVKEIKNGNITVYLSNPGQHKNETCTGCGMCSRKPGAVEYVFTSDKAGTIGPGNIISVKIPKPPFFLSVFLIFILPVFLMAGIPAAGAAAAGKTGFVFLENIWGISLFAFLGLLIGAGIAFCVDRYIRKKYPPVISKQKQD